MHRVVVASTHPIQHFCPLYAFAAREPNLILHVLFGVRGGAAGYFDPGFERRVEFGSSLRLESFPHTFLSDEAEVPRELELGRRKVWDALSLLDPDVVVVYGVRRPTVRWTYLWARLHRRRVAYISDSEDRGVQRTRKRALISKLLAPVAFGGVDLFLSVGDSNEAYYRKRSVGARRITRVPFPIDRDAAARALSDREQLRQQARAELGLSEDQLLLLSVGKLVDGKRHEDLVQAAAIVGNLVVAIAGSGPCAEHLERVGSGLEVDLRLLGFVPPTDLWKWYLAADLYIHPSFYDHHPLAVSEAVYAGLPVIASDTLGSYGPTDDLRPGVNGLVFPMGNVEALAAAIRHLAIDAELRISMSAQSRQIGIENQELAYNGFVEALAKLAASRRNSQRRLDS